MKEIENKDLKTAEKRKIEFANRKKRIKIVLLASVAVLSIVILGVYFGLFVGSNSITNNKSIQSELIQTDSEVLIPLSGISSNAEFYSYDSDGVNIQFFTVRGSDGEIHTAFDTCDVCYDAKKGYKQIDDVMHCINCGKEFPINNIGSENTIGGCWPSNLPSKITEEYVIIEKVDLITKKFMFE